MDTRLSHKQGKLDERRLGGNRGESGEETDAADSLVGSRLNECCESAETRESGGAAGAAAVSEKRLLTLMACFICFHIRWRGADPKGSGGAPLTEGTKISAAWKQKRCAGKTVILSLNFALNQVEALSIAALHDLTTPQPPPPRCTSLRLILPPPPPLPSTCVAEGR